MRNLIFLVGISIVVGVGPVSAFGRDDAWQSGFAQGTCESTITSGAGNQILVSCDCGSLIPSSIYFDIGGKSPATDSIFMSFDGAEPHQFSLWDGSIPSDCRACANNFDAALELMRKHSKVHVMLPTGEGATFTLKGSSEAIGECEADFWK